jgi:Tfp pilus assembly protein PilN
VKFQINIYKPGKRAKAIKGLKAVPKEPSVTRLPLFLFFGAILFIVLAYAYLYSAQVATMKRKMRGDQKKIMILRQFLNDLKEGQSQKSGVEALVLRLQRQRVLWKDKLVELGRLVPDDIRLTDLRMDIQERTPDPRRPRQKVKETVLTIKGESLTSPGQDSLDDIARLIVNLNESSAFNHDFEPIALVYTQQVKTREREFMEFELSGRLQQKPKKG